METAKCNHEWEPHPDYAYLRRCKYCGDLHQNDVPIPHEIPEEQPEEIEEEQMEG